MPVTLVPLQRQLARAQGGLVVVTPTPLQRRLLRTGVPCRVPAGVGAADALDGSGGDYAAPAAAGSSGASVAEASSAPAPCGSVGAPGAAGSGSHDRPSHGGLSPDPWDPLSSFKYELDSPIRHARGQPAAVL